MQCICFTGILTYLYGENDALSANPPLFFSLRICIHDSVFVNGKQETGNTTQGKPQYAILHKYQVQSAVSLYPHSVQSKLNAIRQVTWFPKDGFWEPLGMVLERWVTVFGQGSGICEVGTVVREKDNSMERGRQEKKGLSWFKPRMSLLFQTVQYLP